MKLNTVAFTLSRVLDGIKNGETKHLWFSSDGRGLRKSKRLGFVNSLIFVQWSWRSGPVVGMFARNVFYSWGKEYKEEKCTGYKYLSKR